MPKGRWGLWADLPDPAKLALRAYYRQLLAEYKPRGHLGKAAARLAAELMFTTVGASDLATRAVVARQLGKGRRPKVSRVNGALRRQGMQIGSLSDMLPGGLVGLLAGQNGHKPSILDGVPRKAGLS
jgi:hypothetical protein